MQIDIERFPGSLVPVERLRPCRCARAGIGKRPGAKATPFYHRLRSNDISIGIEPQGGHLVIKVWVR